MSRSCAAAMRRCVRGLGGAIAVLALAASLLCANAAAAPVNPPEAGPAAPESQSAASPAGAAAPTPTPSAPPYAVGLRVVHLVDRTRHVRLPNGRLVARTLITYVRYPAQGAPAPGDELDAPAVQTGRPFPLIVFAHGFAVTPAIYSSLLRSWASAGYVVAAPVFPLENANAPGGPDESDLVNEPADIGFVITRLLAESALATSPLAGLIDATRIAAAGQSDGGEAALAAAYGRRTRDARIDAAVILAGAEMSGTGGYAFGPQAPPLLAVQGTADTINEPKYTYAYFRSARRPKFLLRLIGAQHLPPYTSNAAQLAIVERVSTAFLDTYLKRAAELPQLLSFGAVPSAAALRAEP